MQCSSYGESISTLGFGSRVSEITLGQAKKNSESAQIFEAKDQVVRWGLDCLYYSLASTYRMQLADAVRTLHKPILCAVY